jgi:hypothetical protein
LFRKPTQSRQFPYDRNDFSHDLGVLVVSHLRRPIEVLGIGVHDQVVVLDTAARTQVCSVPLLQDIERLLPYRLGPEMGWSLLAAIHNHEQAVGQRRMQRVSLAPDPEEVA